MNGPLQAVQGDIPANTNYTSAYRFREHIVYLMTGSLELSGYL